jgi:hypothetical protein
VLSVLYIGTCVKGRSITSKLYSFVVCVYVRYYVRGTPDVRSATPDGTGHVGWRITVFIAASL